MVTEEEYNKNEWPVTGCFRDIWILPLSDLGLQAAEALTNWKETGPFDSYQDFLEKMRFPFDDYSQFSRTIDYCIY